MWRSFDFVFFLTILNNVSGHTCHLEGYGCCPFYDYDWVREDVVGSNCPRHEDHPLACEYSVFECCPGTAIPSPGFRGYGCPEPTNTTTTTRVATTSTTTNAFTTVARNDCDTSQFGCCPGVTSGNHTHKVDAVGSNCPKSTNPPSTESPITTATTTATVTFATTTVIIDNTTTITNASVRMNDCETSQFGCCPGVTSGNHTHKVDAVGSNCPKSTNPPSKESPITTATTTTTVTFATTTVIIENTTAITNTSIRTNDCDTSQFGCCPGVTSGNHTHKVDAVGSNCPQITNSPTAPSSVAADRDQIVLSGDYGHLVGTNKVTFLLQCTAILSSNGVRDVECYDVVPGSIIVLVRGSRSALDAALLHVQTEGLKLPSFAALKVATTTTPSEATSRPRQGMSPSATTETNQRSRSNNSFNANEDIYALIIAIAVSIVVLVAIIIAILCIRKHHAACYKVGPRPAQPDSVFGDVEMGHISSKSRQRDDADTDKFDPYGNQFGATGDELPGLEDKALTHESTSPPPTSALAIAEPSSLEDTATEVTPIMGPNRTHNSSDGRRNKSKKEKKGKDDGSSRRKTKRRKQKKRHKSGHMSIEDAADVLTDASDILTDDYT